MGIICSLHEESNLNKYSQAIEIKLRVFDSKVAHALLFPGTHCYMESVYFLQNYFYQRSEASYAYQRPVT